MCHKHYSANYYALRHPPKPIPPTSGEEWRAVTGFEGRYEVSDLGRVRSAITGHIKRPSIDANGYSIVILANGKSTTSRMVRRLVAAAFIGDPPTERLHTVRHLDGDLLNLKATNLNYDRRGGDRASNGRRRFTKQEYRTKSKARRRSRLLTVVVETISVDLLAERDHHRCGICRRIVKVRDRSVDHIVPIAHGGSHQYSNVQLAHVLCNVKRRADGPAQTRLEV